MIKPKRKILPIFALIVVILFYKQLLGFYSWMFVSIDSVDKADAVIVLRSDESAVLAAKDIVANEYYIVGSKEISQKYSELFISDAQKKADLFQNYGIEANILNNIKSVNRFDEALEVSQMLKESEYRHIVLVGSAISSRRTKAVFNYILEGKGYENIHIDFSPIKEIPTNWYKKESHLLTHLLEPFMWLFYLGMLNRY